MIPAIFLAPIIPRMGFYGLKHKAFSIIQDTLRNRFESLRTKASFSDCLSFQRSMMETLSDAENRHAGIMAFRNMFYEFMSNWAQSEYQAMWLLFKEMVADGATCTKRLRQYLALLSNPPLRKEVFGI